MTTTNAAADASRPARTARAAACAWYLDCPECGEGIPDASGSEMWTEPAARTVVECPTCGSWARLPAVLRMTGGRSAQ